MKDQLTTTLLEAIAIIANHDALTVVNDSDDLTAIEAIAKLAAERPGIVNTGKMRHAFAAADTLLIWYKL
jgi:hypothetical protein